MIPSRCIFAGPAKTVQRAHVGRVSSTARLVQSEKHVRGQKSEELGHRAQRPLEALTVLLRGRCLISFSCRDCPARLLAWLWSWRSTKRCWRRSSPRSCRIWTSGSGFLALAAEARSLGHGGISLVSRTSGASRVITAGICELAAGDGPTSGRARCAVGVPQR